MHQYQAPAAESVGGFAQDGRHGAEGFAVQQHPRQRVHAVGVEATGDHDQFRLETLQRRHDHPLHGVAIGVVAAAGEERHIEVVAEPPAGAPFLHRTLADGETVVLVDRQRQHIVAVKEDRLGAITVVHVPVQHRHAANTVAGLGGFHCDGDVRQVAEAHAAIGQAVVPRRPRQGIGVVQFAAKHRIHRRDGQPRRLPGDLVGARPHRSLFAQFAVADVAHGLEARQVLGRMDSQQVLLAGHGRAGQHQPVTEPGHIHQALQPTLGLRRLGMAGTTGRLQPAPHRQHQAVQAGGMPEAALIEEESGTAAHRVPPWASEWVRPPMRQAK
ncbi:hypothetical protein FQZ97_861140 [compost metagenome]